MELVDGFNPTVELPAFYEQSAGIRHAAGLAAVEAIAALGRVDAGSVGLGDLGHPDGFLERQVPRWLRELDSYRAHRDYPGPDLPGLEDVADWLSTHRPPSFAPGLSHGDYHLANVLFRFDTPAVAAIVDWEMCTVGDPLLDLGWLLATWPDLDNPIGGPLVIAGGLPTGEELIVRYGAGSPRDLSHIAWYEVLACLKLAIILEGTHARAFAGLAPVSVGDRLHNTAVELLARAQRRIQGG
jgi:aminoglycoside phosphotransferase (APT) family kinase protein